MALVVLVAALVFGIPALTKATKDGTAPPSADGVAGLRVSNAPDLAKGGGSFLNGYKETWRFSETSKSAIHDYTLLSDAGDVLIANDDAFDFSAEYSTEGSGIIGIDKATGQKLWTGPSTAATGVSCAPKPFGQWIVCHISGDGAAIHTGLWDATTGQEGPALPGISSTAMLESFTVADGALYLQTHDYREPEPVTTTRYTDPSTIAWQVTNRIVLPDDYSQRTSTDQSEGSLVLMRGRNVTVFDADSGDLIDTNRDSQQMALLPGPILLTLGTDGFAIEQQKLAGGKTYCSVATQAAPMLGTGTMPPIVGDGSGAIVGVDPKSCTETWKSTLPFTPYRSAWNGGDIAVISGTNNEIAGLKISDGSVVWQSTLPNHTGSFDPAVTNYPPDGVRGMVQLTDGTILVEYLVSIDLDGPAPATLFTLALDSQTGSRVWQARSGLFGGTYYSDTVAETALQDGFLIAQGSHEITRWEPSDEWSLDAQAASLPQDIPPCPAGMNPLTFSRYQNGAVLVCGTKEGRFAVVAHDSAGKELSATTLSFAGRSCEVGFAGGQTIRLSLGGAWVQSINGSASAQFAASEAWDYRAGATTFNAGVKADGVAQCPAGSWPISLSTWNGGWLLVCGTAADRPTLLAYSDKEAGHGEATAVSVDQGGYCGQVNAGQACAFAAPATVRLPGGKGVQRSASASSFDKQGPGARKGQTGAYGVQAPKDTPEDQVRYLVDILNSSAETRANLQPVLERVNHKDVGSAEIAALATVSDSRRDLRAAVLAAPVDKVPDGQALVTELAHALQVSEDCDRLYVEWAKVVQAGEDDTAIVNKWRPKATESEDAKEAFVDRWNSAIVPQFGVQSFQASQI